MTSYTLEELQRFIVQAKAATYVGSGQKNLAHRPNSHDLEYQAVPFAYLDSYFGGTDFIGQEVVYFTMSPIWAMNYYGHILRPDLIDAAQAGQVIKSSLSALYHEGRFLGNFEHQVGVFLYTDTNEGNVTHFQGKEWISTSGVRVYELVYHGGLIKD